MTMMAITSTRHQQRENLKDRNDRDLEKDIYHYQTERHKTHSYERAYELEQWHEEKDDEHRPNILQVLW